MQHYGMPTRLLDWTEGHLFALYFAVAKHNSSEDAAVWVLDPWSLNYNVIGVHSVPLADHSKLRDHALGSEQDTFGRDIKATHPAAVRPPSATPRIIAQKGTFTIHGNLPAGLDRIANRTKRKTRGGKIRIRRIVIEGTQKTKLVKQLYWAGVTEAVLFPDLVGLCGEISYRYSDEHLRCKCP
jgi:FRG domain.